MHLQFLIAVQEAIEFSLMAFGGFTLFVLVGFGLVKFWLYCLRLPVEPEPAVDGSWYGYNEEQSTKNHEPFSPGQWVRATRDIEWPGLFVAKGQLIQIELAHRTKTDSEPDALRYSGTCYPHALQRRSDGCIYPGPSNFFVYPIPPEAIEAIPGVPVDGCDASRVREDATTGSSQAASG